MTNEKRELLCAYMTKFYRAKEYGDWISMENIVCEAVHRLGKRLVFESIPGARRVWMRYRSRRPRGTARRGGKDIIHPRAGEITETAVTIWKECGGGGIVEGFAPAAGGGKKGRQGGGRIGGWLWRG